MNYDRAKELSRVIEAGNLDHDHLESLLFRELEISYLRGQIAEIDRRCSNLESSVAKSLIETIPRERAS